MSSPTGFATSPPRHTLHIVSGKGGVGKTTIAGALACALATAAAGYCSARSRAAKASPSCSPCPTWSAPRSGEVSRTPFGGSVFGLAIDAEDALLEYSETFYHLGLAGKALDRFGAVDFATSIAPGLSDVLLTGKVYEAVRGGEKRAANAYDAVVLDAPPTGRIAQFLNVHEAVSGLAKVGPIRNQADSIMRVLRSATTVVHLVTLLEDMPVTETEEAVQALEPTHIRVGTVIENMVSSSPLAPAECGRRRTGALTMKVPGLTPKQNSRWPESSPWRRSGPDSSSGGTAGSPSLGLPIAAVDFDPVIDEGAALADRRTAAGPAHPGGPG